MKYKDLFSRLLLIMSSPSKAWVEISQEEDGDQVQNNFVYPMVALCGMALFLGLLIGNGVKDFSFQNALTQCCGMFIGLFGGFFLSTYLVQLVGKHLLNDEIEYGDDDVKKLVGYSMCVTFVLEIFASLFATFYIIKWLLLFYTIYIVWEGSKVMMKVMEDKLLSYTLISSIIIIVCPVIINKVFGWLCLIAN